MIIFRTFAANFQLIRFLILNAKKIILWVVGIWFATGLVYAVVSVLTDSKQEPISETQQVRVQVKEMVDVQGDSLLLMRCKALYEELMELKGRYTFKHFGFSEESPHKDWLKKVQKFTPEESQRLMRAYGIVPGDIEMLGMEYVESRCEETDFTKSKRKELEELFVNPVRRDAE